MKKRVLSVFLVFCLLLALSHAVFAAGDGLILEVTSQEELTAALNKTEPVSEIRITGDFAVNKESLVLFDEAHLAYYRNVTVKIEEGVTLTIEDGGILGVAWFSYTGPWEEGVAPNGKLINNGTIVVKDGGATEGDFAVNNGRIEVEAGGEAVCVNENYGEITVREGGAYRTTQGGSSANHGRIEIEDGAEMTSRFGSTIENAADGTLVLNGVFDCGCIGDGMWFSNEGTVEGHGSVILYAANPDTVPVDLDEMIAKMMDALGQETRFEDWDDIGIYRKVTVSDVDGLRKAAMEERSVKGEPVEGNMDTIIELAEETQLELHEGIGGMVRLIVPEDASLVIQNEGNLTMGIENRGEICVEPGGVLAAVMGGPILNRGGIEIKPGAELRSQMGQAVVNEGRLVLDGTFYCGSFDIDGNNALWFENHEEAGGELYGSGFAVVYLAGTDREDPAAVIDEMCTRMRNVLGIKPIHVFAEAVSEQDLIALNESENPYIRGIVVSTMDDVEDGGIRMFRLTKDLTMKKALWIGANTDLVLDNGATLTLDPIGPFGGGEEGPAPVKSNLLMSWMGRIVTEAAGAASPEAPAGGTLVIGGRKILSGSEEDALLRPTRDIAYVTAPFYLGRDAFPAQAEWLYICEGAAAELGDGELPWITDKSGDRRQLSLIVGEYAALTVKGQVSAGYVELRSGVTIEEGASLKVWDVYYFNEGVVSGGELTVENEETFECRFDLDLHDFQNWSSGIWHYPWDRGGRVYFEDNGVPFEPEREGCVFEGWEISSGWPQVTAEQLAAFTVQEDESGHFVPKPGEFPIIVRARWRSAGEEQPGDVNEDHKVDLKDVQAIFRRISEPTPEPRPILMDVNEDGKVNSRDAITLFRQLIEK